MDRESWERKKRRNRALERRSKMGFLPRKTTVSDHILITQNGAVYQVATDGSWRRIEGR